MKVLLSFLLGIFLIAGTQVTGCANLENPKGSVKQIISQEVKEEPKNEVKKEVKREVKQEVKQEPKKIQEDLVSSSSIYFPKSQGNSENVYNAGVALKALDGKIVQPGEEFSFNNLTGKKTSKNGYIIGYLVKNERGMGGGVCRASTLCFQAAVKGGFNITERHAHSEPVNYAKQGTDATVYYGQLDLKFINNRKAPIKIYASATEQKDGTLTEIRIVELK